MRISKNWEANEPQKQKRKAEHSDRFYVLTTKENAANWRLNWTGGAAFQRSATGRRTVSAWTYKSCTGHWVQHKEKNNQQKAADCVHKLRDCKLFDRLVWELWDTPPTCPPEATSSGTLNRITGSFDKVMDMYEDKTRGVLKDSSLFIVRCSLMI